MNSTNYASTRAYRICRLYGCDGGFKYAAKCLMAEVPLKTVTMLFLISLVILGHALRISEK